MNATKADDANSKYTEKQLEIKKQIDLMEATLARDRQVREQLTALEAECRAAILAMRRGLCDLMRKQAILRQVKKLKHVDTAAQET